MERDSSPKLNLSQEELTEEAKLIRLEILNAQQSLNKSQETTNNLLKTVDNEVKFIDEQKNRRSCLQEQISKFKCVRTSEGQKRSMVANQISLTRQMSQDISKVMEMNNNTAQSIDKTIKDIEWDLSQQKAKQDHNLNSMRSLGKSLDLQIDDMSKALNREREVHQSTLAEADRELEALKQVVASNEKDLAKYKELVQESKGKLKGIINDIKSKKQEIDVVKNNVSRKEAELCELQMLIEKEQEEFNLNFERVRTSLEEIQQSILKVEQSTQTYVDADKHETNNINELLEKIDIQERVKSNLMEEVAKLSQAINDDTSCWDKEIMDLQNKCNTESAEIEKLEIMLQEEKQKQQNIDETNLKNTKIYEENVKVMNDLQSKVKEKELKIESLAGILANLEHENLIGANEVQNLTDELKEAEDRLMSLEHKREEEFVKKNAELNFLQAETEKIISADEEQMKAHIQEMSAIKLHYEIKTFQQTKDFEAALQILKNEEESLEKQLKEKRSQRSTKENDLLKIHQECERVEEQVKNNERMMKFLSSLSALKKKEAVGTSVKTSSELVPPPSKKPFFDQLSGSSADGHVLTMQEVKKLKEEQERRSKLRKLRKKQKEMENKNKK